jgi:hypothetical protein
MVRDKHAPYTCRSVISRLSDVDPAQMKQNLAGGFTQSGRQG